MAYISSSVWGGTPARITTYHGADVRPWNPDCSWYQYAKAYCMNGCQHPGMDIGINRVSLYAIRGGKVMRAGFYNSFRPFHVMIQAENGDLDIYGHMWSISTLVTEGGTVKAGQYLGVSGEQTIKGTMTPDGSGPHLHFEVRRPNSSCTSGFKAIDPYDILTGETNPPPSSGFAINDKIKVVGGPLNVRSGPGTSYGVVASLTTNTEICVTGEPTNANGYTWYRINTGSTEGWVAGQFCNLVEAQGCGETKTFFSSGFAVNDKIKVVEGPLNIRSGPGTSYGVVASLTVNTEICVTDGPTNANGYAWYRINTESTEGWVAGQFCSLVEAQGCSETNLPIFTHRVTGSSLNLRTCASTSCSMIASLPIGTRLRILSGPQQAEGYTWYQIQPEGYASGWSVNGFDPI